MTAKELGDHAAKCLRCQPGLSKAPTLYCAEITETFRELLELRNRDLKRMVQTHRDDFAKAALTGFLSNTNIDMNPPDMADICYRQADAMMKERKEEREVKT